MTADVSLTRRTGQLLGITPSNTSHLEKILSGLGSFIAILGIYWLTAYFEVEPTRLLLLTSIGAATVLVFAVPHSTLSQPWPVVAGNSVSALVGICCYQWIPGEMLASAAAVGLAVVAMYYLRCLHPPGGASALLVVIGGDAIHELGYLFLLIPVLLNTCTLLLAGTLFNSVFPWRRYPHGLRSRPAVNHDIHVGRHAVLSQEDVAAALHQLDSFMDIAMDDISEVIELALQHAEAVNTAPHRIQPASCYSNAQLGSHWSVREVLQANGEKVIFRVVAGDGKGQVGQIPTHHFHGWMRYEVEQKDRLWIKKKAMSIN
ncbi:HPP family protein [Porticoccus sp.]